MTKPLEYNIHKMDNEDFYYYFDVFEDGKNQTHCLLSIKLINTEKQ